MAPSRWGREASLGPAATEMAAGPVNFRDYWKKALTMNTAI